MQNVKVSPTSDSPDLMNHLITVNANGKKTAFSCRSNAPRCSKCPTLSSLFICYIMRLRLFYLKCADRFL